MQPIEINVRVAISLDSALTEVLAKMMGRVHDDGNIIAGATVKQATDSPTPMPFASQVTDDCKEAQKADNAAADAPACSTTEREEKAPVDNYTEVDVRAAMDRTRRRIEGEDYKENSNSEGYKKWHRQLTAWFKNTAALYGSDRPSTLPNSDSRRMFIESCDRVETMPDGTLTENLPY